MTKLKFKIFFLTLLLAVFLPVLSLATDFELFHTTVSGIVLDNGTEEPIDNATVNFYSTNSTFYPYPFASCHTNNGEYFIDLKYFINLLYPPNLIDIEVEAINYEKEIKTDVEILKFVPNNIDFSLKKKKTPVIIVPGILGTDYRGGNRILDPIMHIYDNLYNALLWEGYTPDKDLFDLPYDWGKTNIATAEYLKNKIDEVKIIANVDKVNLITHSMGGLVARQYIENSYENDIDKLIFLGTPHNGATKSYLTWENGDFGPKKIDKIWEVLLTIFAYTRGYDDLYDYIHTHITSVKELLPTYDYLRDADTGQLRDYPDNYPVNTFLDDLNSQENLDTLINSGIDIANIVSDSDISTLDTLVVENSDDDKKWEHGEPTSYEFSFGDGTVLIKSAKGFMGDYSIIVNSDHSDLPTKAINQILTILNPHIIEFPTEHSIEWVTVDDILVITVHSPINILVTAPDGSQIGDGSDLNNQIPLAFYSGTEDPEFITIPNPLEGNYEIKAIGTDSGAYEIEVNYINDTEQKLIQTISGKAKSGENYEHNFDFDSCDYNYYNDHNNQWKIKKFYKTCFKKCLREYNMCSKKYLHNHKFKNFVKNVKNSKKYINIKKCKNNNKRDCNCKIFKFCNDF